MMETERDSFQPDEPNPVMLRSRSALSPRAVRQMVDDVMSIYILSASRQGYMQFKAVIG